MRTAAVLVGALYVVLMVLSRKEMTDSKGNALLQPFYRMAVYLYKKACIYKLPLFGAGQVSKDLARLHPGESRESILTDYYVTKLAQSLIICLLGTFLGLVVSVQAEGTRVLSDTNTVERGSYWEGPRDIRVECLLPDKTHQFRIQVKERRLSGEEAEQLYQDFSRELSKLVSGENTSLEEVSDNLRLQEKYEGYPFTVMWESDAPDYIHSDGTVVLPEENAQEVKMTAVISYEEWQWNDTLRVKVMPAKLSEEEAVYRQVEKLLVSSEEESRGEEQWVLPDSLGEQEIGWKENIKDNGLLLCLGAAAVSVLVYLMKDKDLHDELEKKRGQMRKEYPDMVHTLALYLGAGMTIRGAFQRMASDYERGREEGGAKRPIYEELLYTCRELQAGASEGAAYEHFGKRTGLQEYIRLSTLLTQNLKKGSSTLLQRLREETARASAERLQYGKRLGEEAVTKLLLPMILMLLVVMLIIMIPAFSSVGTY